jgi:putative ABC transport system permease protein
MTFIVILNLILSGLAIQHATEDSAVSARKKLGADVTLEFDMQSAMKSTSTEGKGGFGRIERTPLLVKDAEKLTKLNTVKSYNFETSTFASASSFTEIRQADVESDSNTSDANKGQGRMMGGADPEAIDVTLSGVRELNLLVDFTSETSKLTDGRLLTVDDVNTNNVVIEKNLAIENDLEVGDTIEIASIDDADNKLSIKIVGIYETSTILDENMPIRFGAANPYNKIYVPYTLTSLVITNEEETDASNIINKAVYTLDDPLNIDKFKEEAKTLDIDWTKFKLDANDTAFETMVGPINQVANFSNKTVVIVTVAGALIMSLLLFLIIRERTQEFGILLSLGEKRYKIISQILIELVLLFVIALGISTLTSQKMAQTIGNQLLVNEVQSSSVEENGFIGGMRGMGFGGQGRNQVNPIQADPIDAINVSISQEEWKQVSGIGLLIILISTIMPATLIVRFNPRKILTRNV